MKTLISALARLVGSSRAFQLAIVLGVAATMTAALIGSAYATPPDPCIFGSGF
jgi:hypothetical protein